MIRLNFFFPERQAEAIKELSNKVGIPVAEVLRRMVDHCCQDSILNVLVPPMSGRLRVGTNHKRS